MGAADYRRRLVSPASSLGEHQRKLGIDGAGFMGGAAGETDMVREVTEVITNVLPEFPAGMVAMLRLHRTKRLGKAFLVSTRLTDMRLGAANHVSPVGLLEDRLKDVERRCRLIRQVVAPL